MEGGQKNEERKDGKKTGRKDRRVGGRRKDGKKGKAQDAG